MVSFWPLLDGTINALMARSCSFDLEVQGANGIERTNCWWDSGDANALHGLIRINSYGIVTVTF